MKKLLVAIFALAVAATAATAGVGIQWNALYAVYDHTETDLVNGDNYLLDSYSMIWQLIYSATDTIEVPDPSNAAGRYVGTWPGSDDVVWAERRVAQGGGAAIEWPEAKGTVWNNWPSQQDGNANYVNLDWSTAGFVYQRVFEGTPALGSRYYDTATIPLNTAYAGPPGSPDPFFIDTANAGVQANKVIPEPATMSLLGLGALAMVLRRKIRK